MILAKQNRQLLRDSAAVLLRLARADRWLTGYTAALRKNISKWGKDVADRVRREEDELIPQALFNEWQASLRDLEFKWITNMVAEGFTVARRELGVKSMRGKRRVPRGGPEPIERLGGEFDFLLQGDFRNINEYVKTTSIGETKTGAKRLEKIFKDASEERIEVEVTLPSGDVVTDIRGTTPAGIAKRIENEWVTVTRHKANQIARTGTIWAYNEGALQTYIEFGVTVVEWLATNDDLTCPYCLSLDGAIVSVGQPFAQDGEHISAQFELADGSFSTRTLVTQRVGHPPLHPNCRCVLLPRIETFTAPRIVALPESTAPLAVIT